MKQGWKVLTVLGLFVFSSAWALKLGEPIPMKETKLLNIDGKELSVAEVWGEKGTLVVFSCNHCPYVKAWEERLVKLTDEVQKKGIGVIAINANDPKQVKEDGYEAMKKRAAQKGYSFPYVVDKGSKLARAYGAKKTPEIFLFNPKGQLVYHGAIDDNALAPKKVEKRYLRDAVADLVAGKEIKMAKTRSIGCSIKKYK